MDLQNKITRLKKAHKFPPFNPQFFSLVNQSKNSLDFDCKKNTEIRIVYKSSLLISCLDE